MNPMQTHVKVLGILHIVLGALGILIGLGMLALFGGIAGVVGMNAGGDDAAIAIPILGGIGSLIFIFAMIVSIPGIIAGIGLLSFRPWARILGIIISILNLLNFPFGTIVGFYGIWVLFSRDGAALFERPPTPQYRP
jgi:hypothetical protein